MSEAAVAGLRKELEAAEQQLRGAMALAEDRAIACNLLIRLRHGWLLAGVAVGAVLVAVPAVFLVEAALGTR